MNFKRTLFNQTTYPDFIQKLYTMYVFVRIIALLNIDLKFMLKIEKTEKM
jgi:hypothetical protein